MCAGPPGIVLAALVALMLMQALGGGRASVLPEGRDREGPEALLSAAATIAQFGEGGGDRHIEVVAPGDAGDVARSDSWVE